MIPINQVLFPAFRFGETDPRQAEYLVEQGVGGFCLYGGAIEPAARLIAHLQKKAEIPLLFCADLEDGAGQQFSGATLFPSNMAVGASQKTHWAYIKGKITAVESALLGVRWVLSPVVDINADSENPIINIRAFGEEKKIVLSMAREYLRGVHTQKVLSCLKHFPGHGDTHTDSHLKLPIIRKSFSRLLKQDLAPFRALAPHAGSILAGHLQFPPLDPKFPASFSPKLLAGLLRKKLGFSGLIVTDALTMGGAKGLKGSSRRELQPLVAGADILLYPPHPFQTLRLLKKAVKEPNLEKKIQASIKRILKTKRSLGLFEDRGLPQTKKMDRLGCPEHLRCAAQMAREGLQWIHPPRLRIRPGQKVYFKAFGPKEAERPFLMRLKDAGVRPAPLPGKNLSFRTPTLILFFIGPTAFSGKIDLAMREQASLQNLLRTGRPCLLISFGSPYLLRRFKKTRGALCAFGDSPPSFQAATQELLT